MSINYSEVTDQPPRDRGSSIISVSEERHRRPIPCHGFEVDAAAAAAADLKKQNSQWRLGFALALSIIVLFTEAGGGFYFGSVALLSDATHMFADACAYLFAYLALSKSRQGTTNKFTFGFGRLEVLGSLVSTFFLWGAMGAIVFEATSRLTQAHKPKMDGKMVVVVAGIGLVANVVMFCIMSAGGGGHGHSHGSLTDRSASHATKEEEHHDDEEHHGHSQNVATEQTHLFGTHGDEGHHHAFEWAGIFKLHRGESYTWRAQKVDGAYADASMKMVVLETSAGTEAALEAVEEDAEALLKGASTDVAAGGTLIPGTICHNLVFDDALATTKFVINVSVGDDDQKEEAFFAIFTEHVPTEFELDTHYLQDKQSVDVEPVYEEGGDHGHGHGHGHGHHDGHEDQDLLSRAAVLHILSDIAQNALVIVVGGVVWWRPNLQYLDSLVSYVFAVLVIFSTVRLTREIYNVLMEAAPANINMIDVRNSLEALPGVADAHCLHVWSLAPGQNSLAVHLHISSGADPYQVLKVAKKMIVSSYDLHHSHIQINNSSECLLSGHSHA